MKQSIINALEKYRVDNSVVSKGPLCVVLVITRTAIDEGIPLDPEHLITEGSGQVKGLGRSFVQKILKEYGITTLNVNKDVAFLSGICRILPNFFIRI